MSTPLTITITGEPNAIAELFESATRAQLNNVERARDEVRQRAYVHFTRQAMRDENPEVVQPE